MPRSCARPAARRRSRSSRIAIFPPTSTAPQSGARRRRRAWRLHLGRARSSARGRDIEFGWISATSAGAVNAVALAAGLAEGRRGRLRAPSCATVWEAVAKAGVPDLLRLNPLLAGISRSNAMAQVASLFSPYDFNPLGFDPFRKLLGSAHRFRLLRADARPRAADCRHRGRDAAAPRLFRRREITVRGGAGLRLSAHHPPRRARSTAQAYWDGGFSANPDLVTLGRESSGGATP